MKYSAVRAFDVSIRYNQENNIIESFLDKQRLSGASTFRLESCNVEASCCAVEAVGGTWQISKPGFMGYGDLMFDFLNSPKVERYLPRPDQNTAHNEIIENLAYAVEAFSNVKAKIYYQHSIGDMIEALKRKSAIVLSYKTDYDSGHYLTIVGWADGEFICYDSWSGNVHCKNGGILEHYSEIFFESRMRPRFMEVYNEK